MSPTYQAPGVYVEELPIREPAVADVETALPAFVGYTARAGRREPGELHEQPTRVRSLAEFEEVFGGPRVAPIEVVAERRRMAGPLRLRFVGPAPVFSLYHGIALFFANGGAECVVCSVGRHGDALGAADLARGLDRIAGEDAPTLLLVPEAVQLDAAGHADIARRMLAQCGARGDRFALLDVREGDVPPAGRTVDDAIAAARAAVGDWHLREGALYYPFLRTPQPWPLQPGASGATGANVSVTGAVHGTLDALADAGVAEAVRVALGRCRITVPPSAAIAGVIAALDARRGVWKAPANVVLAGVAGPAVQLDDRAQAGLAIDADGGKSVNAIRLFEGRGTRVWGARTLAGNDPEWRYVPVRRLFIAVEAALRRSLAWASFEPNGPATWVRVRGMVENYLVAKWRQGALAGHKPEAAFRVRCGLGETMTAQDVADGRLVVEVGLAPIRPAEFTVLRLVVSQPAA